MGSKIANVIVNAREGNVNIEAGGGGVYGKVTTKNKISSKFHFIE